MQRARIILEAAGFLIPFDAAASMLPPSVRDTAHVPPGPAYAGGLAEQWAAIQVMPILLNKLLNVQLFVENARQSTAASMLPPAVRDTAHVFPGPEYAGRLAEQWALIQVMPMPLTKLVRSAVAQPIV